MSDRNCISFVWHACAKRSQVSKSLCSLIKSTHCLIVSPEKIDSVTSDNLLPAAFSALAASAIPWPRLLRRPVKIIESMTDARRIHRIAKIG